MSRAEALTRAEMLTGLRLALSIDMKTAPRALPATILALIEIASEAAEQSGASAEQMTEIAEAFYRAGDRLVGGGIE